MKKILILSVVFSIQSVYADNKQIVRDFYDTAFTKRKPAMAMLKYVGDNYIQHNPNVEDGKEPFVDYFNDRFKANPEATTEIKRMIAEGNLVVVHAHSRSNPKDRGYAAIDIFRLENGKIVEHWDTVQAVPEKSANKNTMF